MSSLVSRLLKKSNFPRDGLPDCDGNAPMILRAVNPLKVPKPLCITGCDLSEFYTTQVRQIYQDVTAWASACASAVSSFIRSLSFSKSPF
jgi:hypothetical protein